MKRPFPTLLVLCISVLICTLLHADQNSALPSLERPKNWAQPIELPGLPNLHRVTADLYRSAQPTATSMQELKEMGMKTVVHLRSFHSDRIEIGTAGFDYEHTYPMPVFAGAFRTSHLYSDSSRGCL